MKTITVMAVVAIHTFGYNAVADGSRSSDIGRFAIAVDAASTFSVPVFVMISGTLLLNPAKYSGTGTYLRRRLNRLVPALIFWQLFYWGFRVFVQGEDVSATQYGEWILKGTSYQALYYFWVIIGLVLVGSLLIPWLAVASRRAIVVAGIGFASMPVLTMATHQLRERTDVWIETPWTWWTFYLGLFVLGWGLRGVVARGSALVLLTVGVVLLAASQAYLFRNVDVPRAWIFLAGGSYYSLGTHLYSISIFVWLHSLFAPGGPLGQFTLGRIGAVGTRLGGATLGVYAVHSALIWILVDTGFLGTELVADTGVRLLLRYAVVVAVAFGIALALARVPFVRRVV